jgi:hypothetical protein
MLAVRTADYIRFARPLSARWQTVSMPAATFRQAAILFDDLLPQPTAAPPADHEMIAYAGLVE